MICDIMMPSSNAVAVRYHRPQTLRPNTLPVIMEEDTLVQMRDALPGIINKTENAIRDVLKYIFGNTTFGLNRYNILTKTGSKYELFYHAYIDDFNADFLRISELV